LISIAARAKAPRIEPRPVRDADGLAGQPVMTFGPALCMALGVSSAMWVGLIWLVSSLV
jgi:hypothetical protein